MLATPSRSRAVLACLLAAALLLVVAAPARAGDLHVHLGALPDGTPTPVGPWSGLTDNAPGGTGSFGVSMASVLQGWSHTATLSAPANLSFTSATAQRRVNLPASADHSQPQAQTTWENRGHPYSGATPYGGYGGDTSTGSVTAINPTALSIRLACVNFDGVPGGCGGSSYLIDRLDLQLHDDEAPTVNGAMAGELLDGTWQTGTTASLTVNATDLGSGVYRAFVREGGQTFYALADPAATRCRDARPGNPSAYDFVPSALTLVPCQTAAVTYTPSFDLTQMGDGTHLVSVGIEDASGNERTVLTNRTLRVNATGGSLADPGTSCTGGTYDEAGVCRAGGGGGTPPPGAGGAGPVTPVLAPTAGTIAPAPLAATPAPDTRQGNGANATTNASLSLRANGQPVRRVSVAYGESVVITGQLAGRGGTPISGASLTISAVRGRTVTPQAPVVTGPDGSFRAVIAPGVSRTIHLAYRAFSDDASDADAAELEIGVRSVARLTASPRALHNGESVRFRGQVPGAPAGADKVVEMQVHQDGRWLTFATTRLHGGRFAYRYRFTRTRTRTRYVFRTVVRTDAGWPYETGSSNHVSVEVRP